MWRTPRISAAFPFSLALAIPTLVYGAWRIDPSFRPSIEGTSNAGVFAIAPTPDGKVVVAGAFTKVNGVARPRIARLTPNGTLDPTFAPTTPRTGLFVTVAVQPDGKVLAGSHAPGGPGSPSSEPTLVRYNTDGSLDSSFAPLVNDVSVQSLALMDDGRIMVGLWSESPSGVPLVRLLANGDIDATFPDPTATIKGPVVDLRVLPGNETIVAALFPPSFPARYGAVRLNAEGIVNQQFLISSELGFAWPIAVSSSADGTTAFLAAPGSGRPRPTLFLFNADGTERFAREDGIASGYELWGAVLRETDATLLTSTTGSYSTLGRYTDNGSSDPGFGIELADGPAHDLVFDANGRVLVGGEFTRADGMAYRGAIRLIPDTPPARLANISTRGFIGEGHEVLIAGFVIGGSEVQRVLIRGVAENLAGSGLAGLATDVRIAVYRGADPVPFHQAETWSGLDLETFRIMTTAERLGAFPFADDAIADPAAALELPPGSYTVHAQAKIPGIALLEIYDANGIQANRRLVNLSTRGRVGTGDERLIAGFVIDRGPKRVLVRAVGPGIATLMPGTLADPSIELVRQSDGTVLERNDDWGDAPNAAEIATASSQVAGLQLANGSADAALLVELPAGAYTIVTSGIAATTGIALVEVYEVP